MAQFKVYDKVWVMLGSKPREMLVFAVIESMGYWTHEQILTTPMLRPGEVRQGVQHQPRGRRPKSAEARDSAQ